ncbi:very short patch repair endonuclease [Sphingomonas sp.]|uniref:very short patch repair endonuclease n=1 Tax=Sphingomonas sp. TaxID=28214 RepID=UPI0035C7CFEA
MDHAPARGGEAIPGRLRGPLTRSEQMARVRGRDTDPEMALRRALWSEGIRYRLHARDLPGRPDLVFRSKRLAVFVHGCFWHRHNCPAGTREPKSNQAFWRSKFEVNVARDATVKDALEASGWRVLAIWECELRRATQVRGAVDRVRQTLAEAAG